MYGHSGPHRSSSDIINNLTEQINVLRAQNDSLVAQINVLQADNARLRSQLPAPPAGQGYDPPSAGVLAMPSVLESLAVCQERFRSQGALWQCSRQDCGRPAFDQTCFREGHMAWCNTHNRVITGDYTSCSIRYGERGDCFPVEWQDRPDWRDIVERAFREHKVGRKGLDNNYLNSILFSIPYTGPHSWGGWV
ncbi:hypothetical protein E8E13_010143 [Curvularia kusanoi]|uniref:Uncharacterized protein n=1 Tax=Curvularia kusanoi TaxID=90978 RepID=A0A9P4TIC1_CURKU|nr:hypothetical protein E8E13_010143 [Curvularia kusanoi]